MGFARPGNKGHGVGFIDLNEDGGLEVFAQLGGNYPGDHAYNACYKNLKAKGNHWLELDLRGVKSNRLAIGAQVTVKAGGVLAYREVKGGEGFGATSAYRQHFGLGGNAKIDSVEVRWPSGAVHRFADVPADRVVALKEDESAWRLVK